MCWVCAARIPGPLNAVADSGSRAMGFDVLRTNRPLARAFLKKGILGDIDLRCNLSVRRDLFPDRLAFTRWRPSGTARRFWASSRTSHTSRAGPAPDPPS